MAVRPKSKPGNQDEAFKERETKVSKVAPTYSDEPGREVYHNNDQCTERNNIEDRNKRQGTGGRRLCHRCAELNAAGK